MHGEQPAFWRKVIGHSKHAFLHLTRVFGAEDDKLLILEAEVDARGRTHAGRQAICRKRAGVVDDEIGRAKAGEILLRWTDEHRVHEERVIRPRADHAYLDAMLRVPAGESVEAIEPFRAC